MSKYSQNVVDNKHHNTPWYKIMQWIGDNPKVLDVGCSSGYFGEKLIANKHAQVWGLELDPQDAEEARKRGYQAVFEGDLDNFDWKQIGELKFDAIIFADVLEHVKDPVAVLKATRKLLTKKGCIYASIPNIAHITVRLELLEGNFDYEDTGLLDNTHISFFTLKTIKNTFKEAGLYLQHLDATSNDVPPGQVKSHLRELGLEPQAGFDDVLASQAARTFQYIVAAGQETPPKEVVVPEFSSKLKDDWPKIEKKMQADFETIEKLRSDLEVQTTAHQELENRTTEMDKQLAFIRRHPIRWILGGAYKRLIRK